MVPTVADRPVRVPVAVVSRQQPLDRVRQVGLRPRARLHQRQAACRVRQEHVGEPRSPTGRVRHELLDVVGDVGDQTTPCVDLELERRHSGNPTPVGHGAVSRSGRIMFDPAAVS